MHIIQEGNKHGSFCDAAGNIATYDYIKDLVRKVAASAIPESYAYLASLFRLPAFSLLL